MFKNWSMSSQNRYSNVLWLLESPSMHSMPADKKLPWCKILHWQSQQSSVKILLSPGQPDTRSWWLSDSAGSRTIVPQKSLVTSRSTEVIAHDWSSSGALQVSPPQESNRIAPCRTATPWHLTCFSDLSSTLTSFLHGSKVLQLSDQASRV